MLNILRYVCEWCHLKYVMNYFSGFANHLLLTDISVPQWPSPLLKGEEKYFLCLEVFRKGRSAMEF
jgi:hypothetical protein